MEELYSGSREVPLTRSEDQKMTKTGVSTAFCCQQVVGPADADGKVILLRARDKLDLISDLTWSLGQL